ncbi:hypothetical protein MKX01_006462, partial [Papaver californicum]
MRKQPMAMQVDTVWGRPPKQFHCATNYGVGVDLYGAGCVLVKLLVDQPTMDERTR